MITLRRAQDRQHDRRRKYEVWRSFPAQDQAQAFAGGFGDLEGLSENQLQPGGRVPRRPRRAAEMLTYVNEGAIACEDSLGGSYVIHAGEFQRMSLGRRVQASGLNASAQDGARVFQLCLHCSGAEVEPSQEQRRFSSAQRRGLLCLVASPDGRKGSLRIQPDASLHSALLDPGQHVVHELAGGRGAWLHLIVGEVALGDVILGPGDGAGVTTERAVSITAREVSEILLLDLRAPTGMPTTSP